MALGDKVTETQAKKLAKYSLGISQATVIGSVGFALIGEADFGKKIIILILGLFVATMLLLSFGMRLLMEVKE